MNKKIIDVAHRAGVSPTTVSRVLNDSQLVTDETKLKVQKAIEELGYLPHASAKSLRSQKTMTIGVVVPDINVSYYAEIIKGIENVAYANKYKVLICDSDNSSKKERDYTNLLLDRTVDGLLLTQSQLSDEEIIRIHEYGFQLGVIGRYIEHPTLPCVYTDNRSFSTKVVDYLIENGHERIAFIGGYMDASDSIDRFEGYKQAILNHDIPYLASLVEHGDFDEAGGYAAFMRLLAQGERFSSVFAANDEMALGVYRACKEQAIHIPGELSVVGVDNNRISQYVTPALSTVNQPKYRMGGTHCGKADRSSE
ncbi:LacI family DNA-binding transcriptional regulator [Paenibacillus hexagrammi]|uniref:LacI family DNA-binding transcriptional regulator n=1 Tax=Paenibacillus hexagrammi TaxID=2908839 RepID=UPI002883370D|nr:LacI family DNA-binding transcriptional regulator [Paenibacillus sp. YPD9-1]